MPEAIDRQRAAAELEIRERLAADARTAHLSLADFSPVIGGFSNFAWRAATQGGEWFIRLARAGTRRLGADHANECRVLQQVAQAGLAPPVLRCDPQQRVLVTRWVAGPAPHASVAHAGYLSRLAAAVAHLHALPACANLRTVDFAAQASTLEQAAPVQEAALRSQAAAVFDDLRNSAAPAVLCHHDLNALNIVGDPARQLWLVDWEYAGRGDPVLDLASCASQHAFTDTQTARFLELYRAAGGTCDERRLVLARWGFDYVQWLWYCGFQAQVDERERSLSAQRAAALRQSLQERASRLPHCNN
jgi:thiamine kinase